MVNIQNQINNVIQKRREQLPLIEAHIQQVRDVEKALNELNSALANLVNHPKATDQLRVYLRDFQQYPFRQWIASSLDQLSHVQARLQRETINIGVSGQARVGKSTLLQTIAGLTEEQVPTGTGIPVTAVRSRLRHSTTHSRAILTLHTFETFRDQILEPYHKELKLSSCPTTLVDFESFNYSEPNILGDNAQHSSIVLLERLRKMQKALPSYSADLTGETREVNLEGLRSWVAYPTNEEEKNPNCPRRYLAVRDVLIECRFCAKDVENLTVKCETYFNDNGGRKDQSAALVEGIQKLYRDLLFAVRQEIDSATNKPEILIQYHPIDTIGCVEIKDARWIKESESLGFQAEYRVRPPRHLCPKGADGLLISICRQIVSLEKDKKRVFFSRIWRWFTDEDEKLKKAIETLQAKNFGTRVKHL